MKAFRLCLLFRYVSKGCISRHIDFHSPVITFYFAGRLQISVRPAIEFSWPESLSHKKFCHLFFEVDCFDRARVLVSEF